MPQLVIPDHEGAIAELDKIRGEAQAIAAQIQQLQNQLGQLNERGIGLQYVIATYEQQDTSAGLAVVEA